MAISFSGIGNIYEFTPARVPGALQGSASLPSVSAAMNIAPVLPSPAGTAVSGNEDLTGFHKVMSEMSVANNQQASGASTAAHTAVTVVSAVADQINAITPTSPSTDDTRKRQDSRKVWRRDAREEDALSRIEATGTRSRERVSYASRKRAMDSYEQSLSAWEKM